METYGIIFILMDAVGISGGARGNIQIASRGAIPCAH